jgi:hypothetical protein
LEVFDESAQVLDLLPEFGGLGFDRVDGFLGKGGRRSGREQAESPEEGTKNWFHRYGKKRRRKKTKRLSDTRRQGVV